LDQTLEHFSASVSLVAGQIALFQLEENNVEIRETMSQILSSFRKNLATVTQFNETTLQANCKKSEVVH
jgi:chorismate synthase